MDTRRHEGGRSGCRLRASPRLLKCVEVREGRGDLREIGFAYFYLTPVLERSIILGRMVTALRGYWFCFDQPRGSKRTCNYNAVL